MNPGLFESSRRRAGHLPNPTVKADTLTFSGERQKAQEFWASFKADAHVHKWDMIETRYYFRKALRGVAATWFSSSIEEKNKPIESLSDLEKYFFTKFGLTEAQRDAAEEKLEHIVQDIPVGENIRAYVERVSNICREAKIDEDDPKVMKRFRKGIFNKTVRTVLATETHTTFDFLVASAEKLAQANTTSVRNSTNREGVKLKGLEPGRLQTTQTAQTAQVSAAAAENRPPDPPDNQPNTTEDHTEFFRGMASPVPLTHKYAYAFRNDLVPNDISIPDLLGGLAPGIWEYNWHPLLQMCLTSEKPLPLRPVTDPTTHLPYAPRPDPPTSKLKQQQQKRRPQPPDPTARRGPLGAP
uniref:Retrotransposon gag domain-containing protein n=1 Tax=Chromera velia CCMP2878 TaxID=1169474 RepID=A0A0G4HDU0_9ALVE|eukprot:Cvel_26592.t1-p1 / transcript=Cvel_26592.t1 / gene=Cvel_26592 / organism=Chromera_velia_CCMP2878 / gene_product=hypothetical protein / transcript_product=hypothetical protein / location=Cvel_scaffold3186:1452-3328(+) / protein_length=354 / sequence_SO=supercontig / SO=protein_coding / is_pseudo=false